METCINYTSDRAFVSTDEIWLRNRILRLAEQYPGDVRIIKTAEENDGCIYCELPSKWARISPPRKVEYSDEQRAAMAERMRKAKSTSQIGDDSGDDEEPETMA